MWLRSIGVSSILALVAACSGGSGAPESSVMVSGVVAIESRTRVDRDTADDSRLGQAESNNAPQNAQNLPSTGLVGGYLSARAGNYESSLGQVLSYPQDLSDHYRVSLADGDQIVLHVFPSVETLPGNRVVADMSVALEGDGLDICGVSCQGTPPFIHVISRAEDASGFYNIAVNATDGGPFRYVLSVSSAGAAQKGSAGYITPELVADEAIVIMRPTAGAVQRSAGTTTSASALVQTLGVNNARSLGDNIWQLRRHSVAMAQGFAPASVQSQQAETLLWIDELKKYPEVQLAEPNYLFRIQQITPDDENLYRLQWHYPLINLPLAWQVAPQGGAGVGVAVMDTGLFNIDPDKYGNWHPDLSADTGTNVVSESTDILDYVSVEFDLDNEPGRDENPADPGDGKPQNSSFHGTHVAGIIAAADNGFGVIGVAPSATLYPVRVLGRDGVGSAADLIAALQWAATKNGVDVINLSLGGLGPNEALRKVIDTAYTNGKLVVAAAGNDSSDEPTYPAAFANVVGVGAVDAGRMRAGYSNAGTSVNLVAPGGDASRDANLDGNADLIFSTWGDDSGGVREPTYAGLQGTSMAAPHVAGVFALMKAAARSTGTDINASEFFALLHSGALTDALDNSHEYGFGLINAVKAIDAALDGAIPTVVASSPTAMQLTGQNPVQAVTLKVYPEGKAVTVSSLDGVQSWLSVAPAIVSGSELPETLTVTASNSLSETPDQIYQTKLTLNYRDESGQAQALSIPVTAQYGDPPDDRNAGRHYVLLTRTDGSGEAEAQDVVIATSGEYRFAFTDVAPGQYFLVAGTDMDNNGIICENGEACAEYPVNGFPEPITVTAETPLNVRMTTSFRRPAIATLGQPRYGFSGYKVQSTVSTTIKSVRPN